MKISFVTGLAAVALAAVATPGASAASLNQSGSVHASGSADVAPVNARRSVSRARPEKLRGTTCRLVRIGRRKYVYNCN